MLEPYYSVVKNSWVLQIIWWKLLWMIYEVIASSVRFFMLHLLTIKYTKKSFSELYQSTVFIHGSLVYRSISTSTLIFSSGVENWNINLINCCHWSVWMSGMVCLLVCFFTFWRFKTGFLCVVLAVLELRDEQASVSTSPPTVGIKDVHHHCPA